VADWVTISSLATAGGTLVLAVATFAAVRSSNRAARTAEDSLLQGIRPLLVPSRLDEPAQKAGFADGKWVEVGGGGLAAETTDETVYLVLSIRNVGSGIAVVHGWRFYPEWIHGNEHAPLEEFIRQTVDLYVAVGDTGYWLGTFRDPSTSAFAAAKTAIERQERFAIELLYSDYAGGQRMITRFGMSPRDDGGWLAGVGRHWNLDRAGPR
jgi:hypothetical protein